MRLLQAQAIAEKVVETITPFCRRVEIAGSIRRRKAYAKDVEIVAISWWEDRPDPGDLFGERRLQVNRLHEWATSSECPVQWIKPGTPDIVPWKVEAHGKYWRGLLDDELKLDLFLATPENFGAIFLIRTGSAEFSYAVANHAKKVGRRFVDGYLTVDGKPVPTPEESDVFDLLGLEWREPEERWGWGAVRACNAIAPDITAPAKPSPTAPPIIDRFVWRAGDIEFLPPDERD